MKVMSGLDRPGPFPGNRAGTGGSSPSRGMDGPVRFAAAPRGPVVAMAPAGGLRA